MITQQGDSTEKMNQKSETRPLGLGKVQVRNLATRPLERRSERSLRHLERYRSGAPKFTGAIGGAALRKLSKIC